MIVKKIIAWSSFVLGIIFCLSGVIHIFAISNFQQLASLPLFILSFGLFYSDSNNKLNRIITAIIPYIIFIFSIVVLIYTLSYCSLDFCGGAAGFFMILTIPFFITSFILIFILKEKRPNLAYSISFYILLIPVIIIVFIALSAGWSKYQTTKYEKKIDQKRIILRDQVREILHDYVQKNGQLPESTSDVLLPYDYQIDFINWNVNADGYEVCAWMQSTQTDSCVKGY